MPGDLSHRDPLNPRPLWAPVARYGYWESVPAAGSAGSSAEPGGGLRRAGAADGGGADAVNRPVPVLAPARILGAAGSGMGSGSRT